MHIKNNILDLHDSFYDLVQYFKLGQLKNQTY